jgi:hypothetical protein
LNEWQIQFLVLLSFALQALLLVFSGLRKRTTSGVVRLLLWLAYVSADALAIFVLGHLTLHIINSGQGLGHELVLFWAPFMLLHLGGQETLTAFSMEDNMLWKRHLLGLAQQVVMAAYVVGKEWQGSTQTQLLLAPLVLMFVAGTVRYAERTWALKTAAKSATPGSSSDVSDVHRISTHSYLFHIHKSLQEEEPSYARFVFLAGSGLNRWMAFLMGVMPSLQRGNKKYRFSEKFLSSKNRVQCAYKLVEVQLSLIYDYYYTKFGTRHYHLGTVTSVIPRLLTMGSTCAALTLFVCLHARGSLVSYPRPDIAVSYVLLIGAIVLEIISNILAVSSYWAYLSTAVKDFPRWRAMILSVVKLAHPESRCQWSGKLAQCSLIGGCVAEKQASLLERTIRWIGIDRDMTHVDASSDLKELLLDTLLNVANRQPVVDANAEAKAEVEADADEEAEAEAEAEVEADAEMEGEAEAEVEAEAAVVADEWDFTKFHGQWAKWELQRKWPAGTLSNKAHHDLFSETIERVDFLTSIVIWHIATDMCFANDEARDSPCRDPSKKLSNYILYLASKHGILVGNDGYFVLKMARSEITKFLEVELGDDDKQQAAQDHWKVVKSIRDKVGIGKEHDLAQGHIRKFSRIEVFSDVPILPRANQLCKGLLELKEAGDPWEIIINVWMEMLCYMAPNCGSGFHFKHVSNGGEFVTHVRVLLLNLGLTVFLPQTNST